MPSQDEKARRKSLRKAAGLKRYSELFAERQQREASLHSQRLRQTTILVSYACFACRKCFKKRYEEEPRYKCPQCASEMAHMGKSFKGPRKTETKQWEKVQRLWSAGYRFHTNTSQRRVPAYPNKLREVDDWIKQNPRHPFRLRACWPRG